MVNGLLALHASTPPASMAGTTSHHRTSATQNRRCHRYMSDLSHTRACGHVSYGSATVALLSGSSMGRSTVCSFAAT